jgi:hypothetical protein
MSAPEVIHRLHEQIKRSAWRGYSKGWEGFDIGDGPLPVIPALRQSLAGSSSELQQQVHRAAQDILNRPLEIFGQQWSAAPLDQALAADPLFFHFDPVSRRHWPAEAYCFDISYRDPQGYGDYKFCAELNTLQICQTLAAAAFLENSGKLKELVWTIWNAWCATNTPFLGINWVSGVNIALRTVSLLVTTSLVDVDSPDTRRRMRTFLNAAGFWLDRYPSLYSSANNHLIAESVALFTLGMLAPDLPGSRRYAKLGRKRIEQYALRQILADGVGAEMSPSYAAFAIEWLLLAAVVARGAGQPLKPAILDRLAAAAQAFKWLMDDAGGVPSIGDNDNSCVIASGLRDHRYVASITAAIAGVVGEPALSPVAYDRTLRDAVFHSPPAAAAVPDGIRHFDEGGLSVVREKRKCAQAVLVFDHGPLGYLKLAAHGHADTLAIWLSVGRQPILVDAGTYLYGASGYWREHFRATRAHNTVEIGGESSSVMSGAFIWSRQAHGRLLKADDHGHWSMEADHDGYVAMYGCRHVRRLTRTATGFRVQDRLDKGSAQARIGFLIHPDLATVVDGCAVHVLQGDKPIVSLTSLSEWTPQVLRGQDMPPAGWCSTYFGTKSPADQIVFAGVMDERPIVTGITLHR